MYDADRDPRATGVVGNDSRRGLPGAAPAVPVSALGYVSVRAPVHSDPELRHQEAAIQEFCDRRGWRLVAITLDVESPTGRGLGRPSLTHAIERLQQGEADCVVVARIERLCPSVAELGGILDAVQHADARFVSLEPPLDTGTRVGRAAARLLTRISAWERARRSAMTSAARSKVDVPHTIPRDVSAGSCVCGARSDAPGDSGRAQRRGDPHGSRRCEVASVEVQTALGYKRPRRWTTWANGERPK
jgi:Resolvase, N terminal domain